MLFANSRHVIWGGLPGNVLFAFSVDDKEGMAPMLNPQLVSVDVKLVEN